MAASLARAGETCESGGWGRRLGASVLRWPEPSPGFRPGEGERGQTL